MEQEINTTHLIYSLSEIGAQNAHFTHINEQRDPGTTVKIS